LCASADASAIATQTNASTAHTCETNASTAHTCDTNASTAHTCETNASTAHTCETNASTTNASPTNATAITSPTNATAITSPTNATAITARWWGMLWRQMRQQRQGELCRWPLLLHPPRPPSTILVTIRTICAACSSCSSFFFFSGAAFPAITGTIASQYKRRCVHGHQNEQHSRSFLRQLSSAWPRSSATPSPELHHQDRPRGTLRSQQD
jgi:hypothetical protein